MGVRAFTSGLFEDRASSTRELSSWARGRSLVTDEVRGDQIHGDEVRGAGDHLLDLQFVLGPTWRASSEMMSGKTVSCVITGPQRLTLQCESGEFADAELDTRGGSRASMAPPYL